MGAVIRTPFGAGCSRLGLAAEHGEGVQQGAGTAFRRGGTISRPRPPPLPSPAPRERGASAPRKTAARGRAWKVRARRLGPLSREAGEGTGGGAAIASGTSAGLDGASALKFDGTVRMNSILMRSARDAAHGG